MMCAVVILPALLALWAISTGRWGMLVAAVALYLVLVHVARRSVARPCGRRLRSVPMPTGETLAAGDVPRSRVRTFRGGEADVCP